MATEEKRSHAEPVRAEPLMSHGKNAPMQCVEAARRDGSFDRGLGVAQFVQLLAGDDSVLSRCQAGQLVMDSQFSVHARTKGARASDSPPSPKVSSQKRPHSAGKCELVCRRGRLGPGEGWGNICSLG